MEWLINLKALKSKTSETYKSISEKTGIPQTTVEKIFSGRTKDPKLYTIRSIVHCLGGTLDDLVEESNKANKLFEITEKERQLITAYRNHPEMQAAVNKMLDIPNRTVTETITKDIASEIAEAISEVKSSV